MSKVLVTGCAGFIGSHLVEWLLTQGHEVDGIDNLSTGTLVNLEAVRRDIAPAMWAGFKFLKVDVAEFLFPHQYDVIYHLAAMGSVPRSVELPVQTHHSNVTAFFNLIHRANKAGIRRIVYASSSSVYGDHPGKIRCEEGLGRSRSPYAATKRINEVYADAFASAYGMQLRGLRFFNVYGPRQNPEGPYSAVIPRWIQAMLEGGPVTIHGDGETIRDFTYVQDVVRAIVLAGEVGHSAYPVYNVGTGRGASLSELYSRLCYIVGRDVPPLFQPERTGDTRASVADIGRAHVGLGYSPHWSLVDGLRETVAAIKAARDARASTGAQEART